MMLTTRVARIVLIFACFVAGVSSFVVGFGKFLQIKGIEKRPATSLFAHHVNKKITKRMMDRRPKKTRPSDINRNNTNHGICITKMGLPPDYTVIPAAEFELHNRKDMFKWQDGDPDVEWLDVPPLDLTKAALNPCQEPPPKNMGRMHSGGKGISKSALPYKRAPPSWLKTTPEQVEDQVNKLAKRGLTPSQIGVILRDSNGIAQVKSVTGNKILRILKKSGLAPAIPEDLYMLIKKAVAVRKHLDRNKKDKDSKFRLILIESRIHRLSRYYRTARKLDANWKYQSATASALVA